MRLSQGVYDNRWIVVGLGGSGKCPTVPLSSSITAGVGPMEGVIKLGRKTFRDHGCWCVSAERDDLMLAMAQCGGLVRFAAVLVELNERR